MSPTIPVPGISYRIFYREGNPNNKTIEVRGVIDGHIVARRDGFRGGEPCVRYFLIDPYEWQLLDGGGHISEIIEEE